MIHGKPRFGWSLLVFAGASSGCATTHVYTDHAPATNLAQYRTYRLSEGQVINEGVVDTRDTLVRDRIDSALHEQLAHKCLEPAERNPDLLVTYSAANDVEQRLSTYGPDFSVDPAMTEVWTKLAEEGTLVIDLIDARTHKLVWRAIANAENKDFRTPKNIERAVDKALDKYPTPAAVCTG